MYFIFNPFISHYCYHFPKFGLETDGHAQERENALRVFL